MFQSCFAEISRKWSSAHAHIVYTAQRCNPTSLWLSVCCCVTHNEPWLAPNSPKSVHATAECKLRSTGRHVYMPLRESSVAFHIVTEGAWEGGAFVKNTSLAISTIIVMFTLSSTWWARYVQGKSCLLKAVCSERSTDMLVLTVNIIRPRAIRWAQSLDFPEQQLRQSITRSPNSMT